MTKSFAVWSTAALWALGGCSFPLSEQPLFEAPYYLETSLAVPPPAPVPQGPLKLSDAVGIALANFPSIRAARARIESAQAGISLANTAYLPRLDLIWQEIRSTRNNIAGVRFSDPVILSTSGPVLPSTSWASAWGSSAGALISWEPFDLGFRQATVQVAKVLAAQAKAQELAARLDVAVGAADAFLLLIAAQSTAQAASANVARREVFGTAVHAFVDKQLRPGVDASRADAELATARIQQIQAEQSVNVARVALAQAMGRPGEGVRIEPGSLLGPPQKVETPPTDLAKHPLVVVQSQAINSARARQHALDTLYAPRFNLQVAANDRGSGFDAAGAVDPDAGAWPDRPNWAAGLSITFPLMEIFSIREQRRIEEGNERLEIAQFDLLIQDLQAQDLKAREILSAAVRMADLSPIQLQAARDTEKSARARYSSGLGDVVEVAEAQRLLVQAEIDDALLRLGIWRSILGVARAQGDAALFLDAYSKTSK